MTPRTPKEFITVLYAMSVLSVCFIILDVQKLSFVLELLVHLIKYWSMLIILFPLL